MIQIVYQHGAKAAPAWGCISDNLQNIVFLSGIFV